MNLLQGRDTHPLQIRRPAFWPLKDANLVSQNAEAGQSEPHRLLSYNAPLCDFLQRKIRLSFLKTRSGFHFGLLKEQREWYFVLLNRFTMVVTHLWYHTQTVTLFFFMKQNLAECSKRLLQVPSGLGYHFYKIDRLVAQLRSNEPQPRNRSSFCVLSREAMTI